jgi:hypothetical protein
MRIDLNVALKREIRVLPNLSNAGFSIFYEHHAMSPEVTFVICWETG